MARHIAPGLPLDFRLLASGYLDRYPNDVGALAPGHALAALRAGGHITERARAADFSRRIRSVMPGANGD